MSKVIDHFKEVLTGSTDIGLHVAQFVTQSESLVEPELALHQCMMEGRTANRNCTDF
jgi:hypothetical protein